MEEILKEAFAHMVTNSSRDFEVKAVRLSESGFDPRYRLAKARGDFVPAPHELMTREMFYIGKKVEEDFLAEVSRKMKVLREVVVETPWGDEGHVDAYLPEKRMNIEVKTTSSNGMKEAPKRINLFQVQAYQTFPFKDKSLPPAEKSLIIYIDRECHEEPKIFPVLPVPEYQDLIYRVTERIHEGLKLPHLPGDDFWEGIPLKIFHTPLDFVLWAKANEDTNLFDITPAEMFHRKAAEELASRFIQAKEEGNEAEMDFLSRKLEVYFEAGIKDIPMAFGEKQGILRASKQARSYFSLKKAENCGYQIPIALAPFRKDTEIWVKRPYWTN